MTKGEHGHSQYFEILWPNTLFNWNWFLKSISIFQKKKLFYECKATFQKVFKCSQQSLKFLTSTHQSKAMLFIVQKLNFFVKFNFQHSKHEIVTKFHIWDFLKFSFVNDFIFFYIFFYRCCSLSRGTHNWDNS